MIDATIYQLYDGKYLKMPSPSHYGCISSQESQIVELPQERYSDALSKAVKSGEISNAPGLYLMMEFNENADDWRGMVFTIDESGLFHAGPGTSGRLPRLTTWPPK